jgi:hypothetical protein
MADTRFLPPQRAQTACKWRVTGASLVAGETKMRTNNGSFDSAEEEALEKVKKLCEYESGESQGDYEEGRRSLALQLLDLIKECGA